jgi:hypothetical protein
MINMKLQDLNPLAASRREMQSEPSGMSVQGAARILAVHPRTKTRVQRSLSNRKLSAKSTIELLKL